MKPLIAWLVAICMIWVLPGFGKEKPDYSEIDRQWVERGHEAEATLEELAQKYKANGKLTKKEQCRAKLEGLYPRFRA